MTITTEPRLPLSLQERADRILPGGGLGNMPPTIIVERGEGARLRDINGKTYLDYLLGSGPMILGHGHPEIVAAVSRQIADGTTFFMTNKQAILLAEAICEAVPCADRVRFVSTGTEAVNYATRVVRAFTRKDKILKFEGGFHGMGDHALMSVTPTKDLNYPNAEPSSAGIPKSVRDEVVVAPYNDLVAASELIRMNKDELACVMVEPFQRIIPPLPGFLEGLRDICSQLDIPLVFDEIVTGFRLAYGGAQEYYGVIPDLCTLGKACGGGYAIAAIAGRADIMAHFDQKSVGYDNFVCQLGTLSGNPIAASAGLATLNILRKPNFYTAYFEVGESLMANLRRIISTSGLPAQVVGLPPVFEVIFTEGEIRNYRDMARSDKTISRRYNELMLKYGVLKGETKYYVSKAHDAAIVAETVAIWERVFDELSHEYRH